MVRASRETPAVELVNARTSQAAHTVGVDDAVRRAALNTRKGRKKLWGKVSSGSRLSFGERHLAEHDRAPPVSHNRRMRLCGARFGLVGSPLASHRETE